jgi:hypothetical protein
VVWAAGLGIGVGLVGLVALRPSGSPPTATVATDSTPPTTTHETRSVVGAAPAAEVGDSGEVGEPAPTAVAPAAVALPPRPPGLRHDPGALAARFVGEWLTYPPGTEPAATLAARLRELVTPRYLGLIEGLSTAGTRDRPGSVALLGSTTLLEADPHRIYRVTAWQAVSGVPGAPAGPDSWDVTLAPGTDGWLVDGLRRVG